MKITEFFTLAKKRLLNGLGGYGVSGTTLFIGTYLFRFILGRTEVIVTSICLLCAFSFLIFMGYNSFPLIEATVKSICLILLGDDEYVYIATIVVCGLFYTLLIGSDHYFLHNSRFFFAAILFFLVEVYKTWRSKNRKFKDLSMGKMASPKFVFVLINLVIMVATNGGSIYINKSQYAKGEQRFELSGQKHTDSEGNFKWKDIENDPEILSLKNTLNRLEKQDSTQKAEILTVTQSIYGSKNQAGSKLIATAQHNNEQARLAFETDRSELSLLRGQNIQTQASIAAVSEKLIATQKRLEYAQNRQHEEHLAKVEQIEEAAWWKLFGAELALAFFVFAFIVGTNVVELGIKDVKDDQTSPSITPKINSNSNNYFPNI